MYFLIKTSKKEGRIKKEMGESLIIFQGEIVSMYGDMRSFK